MYGSPRGCRGQSGWRPSRGRRPFLPQRAVALQRCYERREEVIDAFFDLADTIITVRA
jgi:hypothetical protein